MPTKKGQTLIEVVVALGILAIVFAGTVTLIVNVVNLEYSARKRTEAIAIAQGALSETISSLENDCDGATYTGTDDEIEYNEYRYRVDVLNFGLPPDFPADKFSEITVSVTWENKGLPAGEYKIKQMVRK